MRISSLGHVDLAGEAGHRVPALHLGVAVEGVGRDAADLELHPLGRGLADGEPVVVAQPGGDGVVEVVAADPQRPRHHDPPERDHGDLAGAATHVDDHVRVRRVDLQAGADGRGERLLDQVHRPRARRVARLDQRAPLDVGDARRRAHDHPRPRAPAGVRARHEVAQHLLGDLEVGDHAVPERPDGADPRRRAADHALRLVADGVDVAGVGVDGDHRGLGGHDALAADEHERVGGAEVDGDVEAAEAGEEAAAGIAVGAVVRLHERSVWRVRGRAACSPR